MAKILSPQIKKILNWSNGLGIYITKEAKILKWKRNDHVKLTVQDDRIIIEKVKV